MKSANALPPVDFWTVRRIHLHDGIEVQQASVALNQNRQRQPFEEGQVSPAVADRVGVSIIGNVERRPHSLTRLNVPSSLWRNTGRLQRVFEIVGARLSPLETNGACDCSMESQRGNGTCLLDFILAGSFRDR